MNTFNCLIPIFNLSIKFNIPHEILQYIYTIIINNSSNIIIHKWFSYIQIHNTNLVRLINNIPQKYFYNGWYYYNYYDLNDWNLYKTLKICLKYIKPNISDIFWWNNFFEFCLNGRSFITHRNNIINNNLNLIEDLKKLF